VYYPAMKNPAPWVFLLFAVLPVTAQAQTNLETEMQRLQIDTALVLPSQAIDERPVWSPDSRYLAVNVQGEWHKLDTRQLSLQSAKWHGKQIGATSGKPPILPLTDGEMNAWAKTSRHGALRVQIDASTSAEFRHEGLRTSLVLTRKGNKPTVLWKSDLESCEELSVSPNNQYLAYICETNGVFVTDLAAVLPK